MRKVESVKMIELKKRNHVQQKKLYGEKLLYEAVDYAQ